jgi:hypothetical protein
MSTADVFGADYALTVMVGSGTFLLNRLIDRIQVTRSQQGASTVPAAGKGGTVRALKAAETGRPPDGRARYNQHRDAGLEPGEACKAAAIAASTARAYEKERQEAASLWTATRPRTPA